MNAALEAYLSGQGERPAFLDAAPADAHERFLLRAAKRLVRSYELHRAHECGHDDLMLALRNYLLTMQAKIALPALSVAEGNPYGILREADTDRYFAVGQFPTYINRAFAETVFRGEEQLRVRDTRGTNLETDPLIRRITGFAQFKSSAQKLAVYGALNTPDGYTTLVSLPTGGGKSLITQTLAYQREGLTIIVVPTVSLAIDQVRAAKRIVRSAHADEEIFSYSSGVNPAPILEAIRTRRARMLFISPEALINNDNFAQVVREATDVRYLRSIIIDEAHIVIDWGALFRIDYQCLESWRRMLLRSNPAIRTILLSATFEERTVALLKDFFTEGGARWLEIRCDALRHEPRYMLVKAKSRTEKMRRLTELVRTMPHPMIIYVASPDDASDVAEHLGKQGLHNVRTFTGLTAGARRKELIEAWADDEFPIMVATSAFGVGVDKSDVRTVLHLYIPQNANAYYQELGRGGRDGLPCLSIMLCIDPDDLSGAFNRISKKVMTTEKILGRWNSMYNSPRSPRVKQLSHIDTSIRPNYADRDSLEDVPPSEADVNWNVYVLLFLRRHHLIRIHEVVPQADQYIFVIEVLEEVLRSPDAAQETVIEACRTEEWRSYEQAFRQMQKAVKNGGRVCWSEMFYEIYDRVDEFCAGCNAHEAAYEGDARSDALKAPVEEPLRPLAEDQLAFFSGAKSRIVIAGAEEQAALMAKLSPYRIAAVVSDTPLADTLERMATTGNIFLLSSQDLRALVKKKAYYYISGIIVVCYCGSPREIFALFRYVTEKVGTRSDVRLIHVLQENAYFDWLGKSFTDLADGLVLPVRGMI